MAQLLFLGNLGTTEIIILALVVLLLFGGKKIPELMHGVGKGVKSFKKGMNEIEDEKIQNYLKERVVVLSPEEILFISQKLNPIFKE